MYYTDEYFIFVFAFVVLVVAVRLPAMFSSLALHAFFLDLSVSLCLSLTLSVCFYLSHSHSHSLSLSRCSVYLGLLYIITVVRLASCVHHGNHLPTDNWLQPPPPLRLPSHKQHSDLPSLSVRHRKHVTRLTPDGNKFLLMWAEVTSTLREWLLKWSWHFLRQTKK